MNADDSVDDAAPPSPDQGADQLPISTSPTTAPTVTTPTTDNDNVSDNNDDVSDDGTYAPDDNASTEPTVTNTHTRPQRANAGKGVERLEMNMGGQEYASISKLLLIKKCVHALLTQMSAYKGIKKYGQVAIAPLFKELKQLDRGVLEGNPVVVPTDPDVLTPEEKKRALEAVNLIKEKRDGNIKGCTCANGKKQRRYVKQEEIISSPTVSLEIILTTLIIDAYEGRYVSISDVPGAYLHAEMPECKMVLMKLTGQFVDIMCDVNPEYKKYIRYERGVKVLYLRVLRAIYGCLESALLWYNLYSTTLVDMGFELNPYDLCVANKTINGTQCTIAFYVDDNKISHKDPAVVKKVIK